MTTSDDFIKNSEEFVSSPEAISLTGYTRSHIAHLARSQKIDGKLVDNLWYINKESLLNFVSETTKVKETRKRELAEKRKTEYSNKMKEGYISSPDAISLTGYTRNHIAHLARSEKIDGKLVDNLWYINKESLLNFVKDEEERAALRKFELATQRRIEYQKDKTEAKRKVQEVFLQKFLKSTVVIMTALLFVLGIFNLDAHNFVVMDSVNSIKQVTSPASVYSAIQDIPENFSVGVHKIKGFVANLFSRKDKVIVQVENPLIQREEFIQSKTIIKNIVQNNIKTEALQPITNITVTGISMNQLNQALDERSKQIIEHVQAISNVNKDRIINNYTTIAHTNKIDTLGGVAISGSTITSSSISGGSGSFTSLSVGGTGTSTFSGNINTSNIAITALASCDTIDTDANGYFTCGTDATGGGSFGQAWEINANGLLAPTTTIAIHIPSTLFGSSSASFDGTVTANNFIGTSTATSTLSGGLTVDTTTFVLNSVNNRIGIGIANPTTGLDVDVSTDISGDLAISGGSSLTISATGPINQTGTGQVTFAGNVDATNGLDVTTSNFTVGGSNFTVAPATGNTSVGGILSLVGALQASSTAQFDGASRFYSTLQTDGTLTVAGSGTGLSVTNNTSIGGTLALTGAGTFSSTLDVTGELSAATTTLSGELVLSSKKITGLANPSTGSDAANKTYVDSVAQGLDLKDSAKAATTANITLSGEQTIDGVSLVAGDRVLVKDQSDGTKNGIYIVAGGSWSRSTDADQDAEVTSGMFVFVEDGTINSSSGWVITTTDPITVDTTVIAFTQFSGAGQITAGTGLTKSGNTFNAIGTTDRITANADSLDIASTYVGQSSVTTVGTLSSGSISSGFGAIDIGSSALSAGAATFSSINGSAISGTGNLTVSGTGTFSSSVDITGTLSAATTTLSGDLILGGNKITGLSDPTSGQEAATKAYVDAIAQGLTVKASVRVGTTANVTLSGAQTIDGVSAIAGDRVLVKDQSTASENGIYIVASGAWSRSTDADENSEVVSGMYAFVEEGTAQANTSWSLITADPITVDTTSLTFTQFSGSSDITAGDGLTKSGLTVNVVGTTDRITVSADSLDIASTYVGQSSFTTVGTLSSGSISSGFGAIDIGSSVLSAGIATIASLTSYGDLSVGATATTTIKGDNATSTFSGGISLAVGNLNLATGGSFLINDTNILNASTLGSSVTGSSLTSVGALTSGSIVTGFGAINIGADTLDAGTTTITNLIVQNTSESTFAGGVSISGQTTLATSLNGPLQANAGIVSATTSVLAQYGGTGQTTYTTGDILYSSGSNTLSKLAVGTGGYVLGVVGGVPGWVATTTFAGGLTYSGGNVTADLGTSVDLTAEVTGTLPIANGGTGTTTSVAGGILFSDGSTYKQDSTNLFWDNTNNRLGIASSSPYVPLGVTGNAVITGSLTLPSETSTDGLQIGDNYRISKFNSPILQIYETTGAASSVVVGVIDSSNGIFEAAGEGPGEGTSGGRFRLRTAADHDATIDAFDITASADDLVFADSANARQYLSFKDLTEVIINNGADDLDFRVETVGNTHGLFVDATLGNVGIGTSSPYAKLSVVGEVVASHFTATSTTATSTFAGGLAIETSGFVYDYTSNNVGIGRANPSYKLDINAGTSATSGGTNYGANVFFLATPGSASNANYIAEYALTNFNSTADNAGSVIGLRATGYAADNRSNVVAGFDGIAQYAGNDTAALTTSLYGARLQSVNSGTGRVTHAMGFKVASPTNNGTVDIQYGGYISDVSGGTDNAGLHFEGAGSDNAISFSGAGGSTPNARIYSDNANELTINATSNLLLNPTGTGNVGIGTTSPYAKLSVTNTGTGPSFLVEDSTSPDTTPFAITASGDVGIGILNPGAKLQINGIVRSDIIGGQGGFEVRDDGTNVAGIIDISAGSKIGGLQLYNDGTQQVSLTAAGASDMYIVNASGANLGIGTKTPNQKLDVNGIIQAYNGDTLADPSTALGNGARFSLNSGDGSSNAYAIGLGAVDGTKYPMWFQTGSGNGGGFEWYIGTTEKMRIDQSGNVGIGTTTPAAKLEIAGSNTDGIRLLGAAYNEVADIYVSSGGGLILDTTPGSDTSQFLDIRTEDNSYGLILRQSNGLGSIYSNFYVTNSTSDYVNIVVNANSAVAGLVVNEAENVGVGVFDPAKRLEVFDTVSDSQFMISYDATRYTTFQVDSVGDLYIDAQGGDVVMNDENLWVCAGGSCPSTSKAAVTGGITVENEIVVAKGGSITVDENLHVTTTGTIAIDWNEGNSQLVRRTGSAAITFTFSNYSPGQRLLLTVCNRVTQSGGITWPAVVKWAGGTTPTDTKTDEHCDIYSFVTSDATVGTDTVFGAQTADFTP